jgi:hypothetical protein
MGSGIPTISENTPEIFPDGRIFVKNGQQHTIERPLAGATGLSMRKPAWQLEFHAALG